MRFAFRLFIVLALIGVLILGGGYLHLRRSLPEVQGEIAVAGLSGPAEILRDAFGIPHIFARSVEDAQFALGFAHAQDRLWQMEMNRRTGSARLAEVLGVRAVDTDRFLRTLGLRQVAEANLKGYDEETRRQLEAYAAGVNAFLDTDPVLPPEFWIFGVKPEPWTPVDSVVWTKIMAWDLGGNWRNELLRLRMAKTLPLERIEEFFPPYPGEAAVKLPDLLAEKGSGPFSRISALAEKGPDPFFLVGGASNSWVVSGDRTASGKPLLANDPHLGLTAPVVWYFVHLNAPGMDVIGASLPGVPGILLGRNQRIAWGFTNTGPDVQDLYLEDENGSFTTIEETIKVKDAPDVTLRVRRSRHGPVISDVSPLAASAAPAGRAIAMAWTALADDDLTMQAGLKLARAENWEQFLEALRDFHVPQQNVTYADVDGNIGFVAAGKVPVRKPGNARKGLAPAPGSDTRYDWAGAIPFDELPRAYNPPSGAIVTANHKITPSKYPHYITSEWQPPYRARRIEELLAAVRHHGAPSFARIQLDTYSLAARELLPFLLETAPRTADAAEAVSMLAAWDGNMAADRAEPLILVAWWRELARALFADELGEAFRSAWSTRAMFLVRILEGKGNEASWCDDVNTKEIETCAYVLQASLESALEDLRRRYGSELREWKWGEAHEARLRHRPLTGSSWLRRWFDIVVPSPGDAYTVNVGRSDFVDEQDPYGNRHAASLRAIYDLADPQASLFIHPGGQSGNPFSAHYRSFADAWRHGEYAPMLTDRARLEKAGVQRLMLVPRK
ncbi:MAG TPA: penicillin acylase family protein [Burkholderiales bacterium]|nr:penicillin acylase family protein [Burkholderiales bacterium]